MHQTTSHIFLYRNFLKRTVGTSGMDLVFEGSRRLIQKRGPYHGQHYIIFHIQNSNTFVFGFGFVVWEAGREFRFLRMGSRKLPISNGSFEFLMYSNAENYEKAREILSAFLNPEVPEAEVKRVLNVTLVALGGRIRSLYQNCDGFIERMREKHSVWLAQGVRIPPSILRSEFPGVVDKIDCSNISTATNNDGEIPDSNVCEDNPNPEVINNARTECHQDLPNLTIGDLKTLRQCKTMNRFIKAEIETVKPHLKKHLGSEDLGILRQTLTELKEKFHCHWADSYYDNTVFERKFKYWLESPVRVPMSLLHSELMDKTATSSCSNCQAEIRRTQYIGDADANKTDIQHKLESLEAFKTVFEGLLKWNNNVKLPKHVTGNSLPILCSTCDSLLIGIHKMYTEFMGRTNAIAPVHIILGNSNAWKSGKPLIPSSVQNNSTELPCSLPNETLCVRNETNPRIATEPADADLAHRDEFVEMEFLNDLEQENFNETSRHSPMEQEDAEVYPGIAMIQNSATTSQAVSPGRQGRRKQSLKKLVHQPKPMYKCPQCPKMFNGLPILNRHIKLHSTARSLPCSKCGELVKTKFHLDMHMRIHKRNSRSTRSFPCPVKDCATAYISSTKINLLTHLRKTHPGYSAPLPFACKECDRHFSEKSYLDRHVFLRHSTHTCALCSKAFKSPSALASHMKSHNEDFVDCHICGKKLKSQGLLAHFKTHDEDRKHEYLCALCGRGFYHPESYRAHMRTVHEGLRKYGCDQCGQQFTRPNCLKQHIQAKHSPEGSGFPCPICGKIFKATGYLQQHLRSKVHGGPGQKRDRDKVKRTRKPQAQNEEQTGVDQEMEQMDPLPVHTTSSTEGNSSDQSPSVIDIEYHGVGYKFEIS